MANGTTPHLGLILPEVNADDDEWGNDLNTDLTDLDTWAATVDSELAALQPIATATDIWAGTDNAKRVTSAALYAAAAFQVLTDAATTAWDMAGGFNASWAPAGSHTLSAPADAHPGIGSILQVIQPATGGPVTPTLPSCFDFGGVGTPTFSTAAGAIDVISLVCLATSPLRFRAVFSRGT